MKRMISFMFALAVCTAGVSCGGKKEKPDGSAYFAGGNGAGVSVTPLGFIAVEDGKVRLINLAEPSSYSSPQDPVNKTLDGINGVIDKAPEIIDKVKDFISDRKKKKSEDITAEELEEVEEEIRNG